MRAMKDSGIEWIGQIPQEWKTIRLRSQFSFGKGLPNTKADLTESGIAVISYGQIHSKANIGTTIKPELIRYVDPKYLTTNESSVVTNGDFIFADTSEDISGCGNCVYIDVDYPLFAGYHTLILRPENKASTKYYSYLFATDAWRSQIRAQASGVKLFSITQKMLRDTLLIEPSKEEKNRIVEYLDDKCAAIDALIAAKEKTNALLKERRQSIIYEAVTKGLNPDAPTKDSGIEWIGEIPEHWTVKKIKYLGTFRNGLTYSPDNVTNEESGTLVLRSSNIQNGNVVFDDNVYVDMDIPEILQVAAGDILICSRNGSRELIGKNAIIPENVKASFGAFMMIFRCGDPKYLYYILNSNVFSYYLGTFLTSTVNQLTAANFGNMKVVYCDSAEEREEIVAHLDQKCEELDAAISTNEATIQKLKEYRQSIIYEAVTGKIEL